MGIKNLFQTLRKAEEKKGIRVFHEVPLSQLRGERIAVDISGFLYQYKIARPDNWLTSMASLFLIMRKHNLHPVLIFDGTPPKEKAEEREKRNKRTDYIEDKYLALSDAIEKYKTSKSVTQILRDEMKKDPDNQITSMLVPEKTPINIKYLESRLEKIGNQIVTFTKQDMQQLRQLILILRLQSIQSPHEAEAYAAQINQFRYVLSSDGDVLAHGKDLIRKIDIASETATLVRVVDVLEVMGMDESTFLDFCIMCKCDYNNNIPLIGPVKSQRLLEQHGSIEAIRDNTTHDTSILKFERCRELFRLHKIDLDIPWSGILTHEELFRRLSDIGCSFSENQIKGKYARIPPKIKWVSSKPDKLIEKKSLESSTSEDSVDKQLIDVARNTKSSKSENISDSDTSSDDSSDEDSD